MSHEAMTVTLKANNCITNDPCAWCGERTDPAGLDFFVPGTWSLVCAECARVRAPEVYAEQGEFLEAGAFDIQDARSRERARRLRHYERTDMDFIDEL
jgi:hypothetical protein